MRDYLEELLELLPPEEETAPARWLSETEAGFFQQEEAVEQGIFSEESDVWMKLPAFPDTRDTAETPLELLPGQEAAPQQPKGDTELLSERGQDPALPQESKGETEDFSPAPAPLSAERGGLEQLARQEQLRRRPAMWAQAQSLTRALAQAQVLAREGRREGRALRQSGGGGEVAHILPPSAGENGQRQTAPEDRLPQEEAQARSVDRAFQRDSRRYDRGFSLY